jgi:Putative Flp pilus-assembly TadE/G-like
MHLRGGVPRPHGNRERGSIIVLFALLMPVLFAIGAIVISVGNWYVLKRHLQTQVDAAALAGGPAFTGCFQDPTAARDAIAQAALQYAGDPTRAPATANLLMQDAPDVHVVLNSSSYWASGDPTDGTNDWTIASPGTPCETKYLDVKATDDSAPLLWGFIPFSPSLETRAKVRVSEVRTTDGLRPLGVPENDPEQVAVLVVDEADGSIKGKSLLDPQSTPPTGLEDMSVWSRDFIAPVDLSGDRDFGVIIVASRSTTPLDLNQTLAQICSSGSGQVECYGGSTPTSGISFIHAYQSAGTGSAANPIVRGVSLSGGCTQDLSKPYFNFEGGCALTITAQVDFGTGSGDPRPRASSGGVCAEVSSSQVQGNQLSYSTTTGLWSGTVNANADGPTAITFSWSTDTNGACGGPGRQSGSFGKVAEPYASDAASGPVQYLTVERAGGVGLANSIAQSATESLKVTVGLFPPLREGALTDPAIPLRFWDTPSQSQALDCDASGTKGWSDGMEDGCTDPYQAYDESKHVTKCGPPPAGVPAADPLDCIESENGRFQQKVVEDMLTPCAANPNRWDGTTIPPAWDKRWMPLFVLDQMAFDVSGKKTYPIRRFGMFYVTAVSGLNCPADEPAFVDRNSRELWGHFMSFITPGFGQTIPSDEPCSFGNGSLCVSNLVE